ncbi:MAG: hypothetical protein HYV37_03305 [Candidatus Levyibacteriota bacterium]|nr:MAG: hypothetical protein HYV37_03305 [Candidatus Levybacteria bacterium]
MKSVRIYKDDIRTHILRSLFFTDTALVVIGSIVIGALLYFLFVYVFHSFNWGYYISSLFLGVLCFILFITQRIDNQPIFKVVPRAIRFTTGKKNQRFADLEDYFVDFTIKDNLIVRDNTIIGVYEIEPFDVALLNEQDREHFYVKLKQAIHILSSQIQLIVKKDQAKTTDYSNHFFSLYESSSKKREQLINQYLEDLTTIIDENHFMMTRHFAVLSIPCDPTKPNSLVQGVKRLNDLSLRFAQSLALCNISIQALENEQLKHFMKETLR